MKTGATRLYFSGLALCLCLVFCSFAARCQPTFGGITAYAGINFNGNEVTLDSFNSADPNHSIWQTGMTWHGIPYGVYSDSLSYSSNSLPSRTADFTLASDQSVTFVGNAQIYGYVNTTPEGTAFLNQNGSVGDLNWVSLGTPGIELGHEEDDMSQIFYSKSLPNPAANGWQTTWLPVPAAPGGSTNIGGVAYALLITNRPANSNFVYYSIGLLAQSIFIDASNVVLYLTNGMSLSGSARFTLNTNADVSIYSSGNVNMSALAVISNLTEYSRALSIYDVAGDTNLSFNFAGNFGPAFLYAPATSVKFAGGGAGAYTVIGATFCNDISVTGHYNFHYDESLADTAFPIPPAIIEQPTDQYVQVGSNATFSVVAGGSPTAYQWFFMQSLGTNVLFGATNSTLTITNAQRSNGGYYYVEMLYTNTSAASSLAWLTVYTNTTANLSAVIYTNGQFQLLIENPSAYGRMPYILQASTNLTDWAPILTNGTPIFYTETNVFPQRYYRAVFAP